MYFIYLSPFFSLLANGSRYPLGVGGWSRPRNGSPRKLGKGLKNAARTPSRVHAVLGGACHNPSNKQGFLTIFET